MKFQLGSYRSYIYVLIGVLATISIAVAVGLWRYNIDQKTFDARYAALTKEFSERIGDRFQLYQYGLRGARGAIVAADEGQATRQSFEKYSQTRDPAVEFPGARGFGYIERVPKDQVEAFVAKARLDGFPDFAVREISPNPAERFLIKFIYPLKGNEGATGLDIGSEANRRNAAKDAALTGEVRLTAPITLVQASGQINHGFLILMPIYKSHSPIKTMENRTDANYGWSYAPLVVSEVLRDLGPRQSDVAFSITDVEKSIDFYHSPRFDVQNTQSSRNIQIFGREWKINFHYTPEFIAHEKNSQSFALVGIIFLAGALLTAIVFGVEKNRERKWQLQSAESSNRVKSEFLASMSHEVRTPMTGIIGFADLLLEDELPKDSREKVENIQNLASALLTILNDILDISKLDAGKLVIEKINFNPARIANDVTHLFCQTCPVEKKDRLSITTKIAPDFPKGVNADPSRLRQVLINLVGNAVKFTDNGSVTLHCEKLPNTDILKFRVEDTGVGIDRETQEKLFRDFVQADASISRKYQGTGLGLSICKRLVELMGGEIGIKGALGEGSTFWFTLPYKPLREGVEIIDEQSSNQHEFKSVRKLIILVAEDNEINQVIIKALLEKMGHEVTFANNGYEAVDEVKVHDYDLILMDVRMPGLSGPDATIQIRQLDGYKADIPIIALTADMMADNRKSYFDAGMNDCVGKPINPEELAVAINNAVRASQDGDEQAISRPAFDFEEVKTRLMLPDDVIMPLFTQFAEQYRDVAERIQELTGKNDLNAVREIAHSLKGVSGTLGMKDISKQASEIELYAKDMNADAVARNIPALAASTVEAVAAINARINS